MPKQEKEVPRKKSSKSHFTPYYQVWSWVSRFHPQSLGLYRIQKQGMKQIEGMGQGMELEGTFCITVLREGFVCLFRCEHTVTLPNCQNPCCYIQVRNAMKECRPVLGSYQKQVQTPSCYFLIPWWKPPGLWGFSNKISRTGNVQNKIQDQVMQ